MRRLASIVVLALTLVVPQAHAQDTFGAPPLTPPRNPALAPGGRLGPRVPPALVAAAWARAVLAARRPLFGAAAAETLAVKLPAEPPTPTSDVLARRAGLLGPYADLGLQLNLRMELKADQFRNLRCSSEERLLAISGCNAGFPTVTPNPQYAVRTNGVVGQRLHINVDFDSQREFDANNNLQIWYEGLEDEILRRVEAGNVTFQAPPSRFISAAIPANNFGVQAIAQVGPVEFRSIFAQQKGSIVKDRFYTVGEVTSEPIDREARDLDYETGRFFFVIDPAAVPGYPAIDILALAQTPRPPALTVGGLRVYRRRSIAPGPGGPGNQNVGGVRAVACGAGTIAIDCVPERAGPFEWEILQEGKDYYVDPSGTWFALANRLDQNDYLAVSYVTADGADSVGTFPLAANPDTTVVDTLRLVYDPKPGITATAPSFRFEIRNAYRVGGREIDRQSVAVSLSVNQRERTAAGKTYLELLGVALETDPNRFDQYNRLFPRSRDPHQGDPVRDMFVIFPHLFPFADSALLGATERNDSLYRTPRAYLSTQAPPSVFAVQLHLAASASADRSVLALNSFQIREGSERIYVGDALLQRSIDYTIDYTTGQVLFTRPDSLFGSSGTTQVRAQFEERSAFNVAPTSIYGLAARYDLGTVGEVNFTGMFQKEQSTFTRPPLGFEPSSSFIGGLSTRLRFEPTWLTRVVDALPGVRTDAPSFINAAAELAVSKPSPNRLGQAYLEEFEGESARFIPLSEKVWHWGSIPSSVRGAEPFGFVSSFDPANATFLTWQSLPYNFRNGGYAPVQFLPRDIDPTLRFVGQAQSAEPVLWLMLKPDTVLGLANNRIGSPAAGLPNWTRPPRHAPRWRSITQALSPTGIDLSRIEFLEFWVWEDGARNAKTNGAAILLDFGSIFEDALAFVPQKFTVDANGDTTYFGIRAAGVGRLDTERDPRTKTWSATINDEGILSDRVVDGILDSTRGVVIDTLPLCSVTENGRVVPYTFGDIRSRCGRHNGSIDTEDQDDDFELDSLSGVRTSESFVRYVFPIGDDRYFVREGKFLPDPAGGSAGWRLYRIPFRSDTLQIGNPNLRQVQAVRLTVVVPATAPPAPDPQIFFGLSRVRLVGSSWVKRSQTPIRGIGGETGTGVGEVIASIVSSENRDLDYTSPPGVEDEAGRRDANFQLGAVQVNERSMRLLARGLRAGDRAESYLRFTTEGDKNFLKYKKLRVWARGRGPGWDDGGGGGGGEGGGGDLEFFIKAGKDQNNFYMYHAPARTDTWEPEVVAAFEPWLLLRARIEQAWLAGDTAQVFPGCPDSTLVPHDGAYVMCDGPYIVHVRDPGTAPPNLARVQEIAAGIWRVGSAVPVDEAELWVDDIRLSDVVQEAGAAGALDLSIVAADLGDFSLNLSRRDGQFRQLGEDPKYVTDNNAVVGGTLRLDRFLPAAWGMSIPVTARYALSGSEPFYLNRSDIRADVLQGLRTPRNSATTYSFAVRRQRRAQSGLARWLLDPVGLTGAYASGNTRAELSSATSSNYALDLDYSVLPGAATWRILGARLRLNPSAIRFRSGIAGIDAERLTFTVPIPRVTDTLPPAVSRTRVWRNSAGIDLLPLGGVQLSVNAGTTRDLRDYGDSTTIGRLAREGRGTLIGQNIGIETQRTLTTAFSVNPRIATWIRPRVALASLFSFTRDPNAREPVRTIGDSAGDFRIPVAYSNSRRFDAGTTLDPGILGRALFGDSSSLGDWLAKIGNLDVSYSRQRNSSFNRAGDLPSLAYQLAFGSLDDFRRVGNLLAASAGENSGLSAGAALALGLGLRATASYRRTWGIAWSLRTDQQLPIRTSSRDWPSGTINWTFAPPRNSVGKVLSSLSAGLTYRRSLTANEQPSFGSETGVTRTSTLDRTVAPTLSLTWAGVITTSFDASRGKSEQDAAGSLFRTTRNQQNAALTFSFRPPRSFGRWRSNIRTTARYTSADNAVCLRGAGQTACVPYVDSRQAQAQLTMDTDLPSNMSAGLQMAYLLNAERQTNRRTSQLLITAFVSLSTSVGQLR
jgi:hypothetical protein